MSNQKSCLFYMLSTIICLGYSLIVTAATPPPPASKPQPEIPAVKFLPDRIAGKITAPADSMWGICGHFTHHTYFDRSFSGYWSPDYTIPWLIRGNIAWVREPLYLKAYVDKDGKLNEQRGRDIDQYLTRYDQIGIKVLLCPMFDLPGPALDRFINWVAELAIKHPCVKVIELHNEPNLKDFWKHTPQDYVRSCKAAYQIIKAKVPEITVSSGAFSNFGKAAEHEYLVKKFQTGEKISTNRKIATGYMRECLEAGMLDACDAVSWHPYNSTSEGAGSYWMSEQDPDGFEKEFLAVSEEVQSFNTTKKPLKFYFTELGRSTDADTLEACHRQANYLSRVMLVYLALRLDGYPLEGVFWYDLKCDDAKVGVHEANYGLISNAASNGRPSFWYYKEIIKYFGSPEWFEKTNLKVSFSNYPGSIKSYVWKKKSNGNLIVPFWRMIQQPKPENDFMAELKMTNVSGKISEVLLFDPAVPEARSIGFVQKGNTLEIPLNVFARANWLEIKTIGE